MITLDMGGGILLLVLYQYRTLLCFGGIGNYSVYRYVCIFIEIFALKDFSIKHAGALEEPNRKLGHYIKYLPSFSTQFASSAPPHQRCVHKHINPIHRDPSLPSKMSLVSKHFR